MVTYNFVAIARLNEVPNDSICGVVTRYSSDPSSHHDRIDIMGIVRDVSDLTEIVSKSNTKVCLTVHYDYI